MENKVDTTLKVHLSSDGYQYCKMDVNRVGLSSEAGYTQNCTQMVFTGVH